MNAENSTTILAENEEMVPQMFYDLLVKVLGPEIDIIDIKEPVLEVIEISNIPDEELERVMKEIRDAGGTVTES